MITPMEIQNHEFTVKMRGYEREEVRHFLYAISEEFDNLLEQNHKLAQELAVLKERIKDMTSRDKILKDTLITAQQVKAEITENARKEADLIVKEGQLKAEAYHEEAKREVDRELRRLADLRRVRNDILAETEMMVSRFNHFVEAEREMAVESDKLHKFQSQKKAQKPPAREVEGGNTVSLPKSAIKSLKSAN